MFATGLVGLSSWKTVSWTLILRNWAFASSSILYSKPEAEYKASDIFNFLHNENKSIRHVSFT